MPHLDICTYMVQHSWTTITFLSLYTIISVKYLPKIGKILHTRVKKVMDTQGQTDTHTRTSVSTAIFKNSLSL